MLFLVFLHCRFPSEKREGRTAVGPASLGKPCGPSPLVEPPPPRPVSPQAKP